uniref:C2H2-type domain-containing protein n=1 Tax=viral metagenome TaxID=1070528 RepID=A0A6C0ERW4_9ZZZZ
MFTSVCKKTPISYVCDNCHFKSSKKSEWDRHIMTRKHKNVYKMLTNVDICDAENAENAENVKKYTCDCGKEYAYRQSLYVHKKKCTMQDLSGCVVSDKDELIKYLINENSDLKNMVLDICKQIQPSNVNTNVINNSNNKTFNLNVFLNEQCKDAMNIMDFVDSLKLQLSDLEIVGKLGFVEGISNIIVKNLKAMDIHKRPVHCSDSKREVMYVKDENKWGKENEENIKLRKAIKYIAHKNTKLLPEFKDKYPDCGKSESKHSEQYSKLVVEAMGGRGDNESEKEDKIIKNIAKEVTIDKQLI